MQKILKFTLLVFLFTIFSCETIVPKEYNLRARTYKQEEELNRLVSEEGIYKVNMDSSNHILSFKYSQRQTELEELEAFLQKNNLINLDTTYLDSSYFLVDTLELAIDSLKTTDSVIPFEDSVNEVLEEIEEIVEEIIEEKVLEEEVLPSIKKDSIIKPFQTKLDTPQVKAPVIEMPSVEF